MSTHVLTNNVQDLVELAKPRITILALVTTFTGMWIASGGMPPAPLILFTLLGTALGSSAAGTLNNYVDREIDQKMSRTRNRCLPSGRVDATTALGLGILFLSLGIGLLAWQVNLFSALILLGTVLFYVFVYTLWLKRSSPLSTEVGGFAGAMPPVIGWVAVTGSLGLEALALFLVMFIWQPPHFWALGIRYRDDYENAGLPRLPVEYGEEATKHRILFYTLLLIPTSLSLFFLGSVGWVYLGVATVLGAGYVYKTIEFVRNPITPASAQDLFSTSNLYLFLLFVFMFLNCTS